MRAKSEPDVFDPFEASVRQRLVDDQHMWATTLFDEVAALGESRWWFVASPQASVEHEGIWVAVTEGTSDTIKHEAAIDGGRPALVGTQ